MSKPNESLIQYLWIQKKIPAIGLCTTSGKKIEIVSYGQVNTLGGPDIFQAKVKIGSTFWVGNVEFHVHASDWYKHNHHLDSAYNNVILHVVLYDDQEIRVQDKPIDTFVVPPSLMNFYANKFHSFLNPDIHSSLPCTPFLNEFSTFHLESWKLRLLVERWELKLQEITPKNEIYNFVWSMIMTTFGVKYNKVPMQMIADSIDFRKLKNLESHELDTMFLKLSQLEMPISVDHHLQIQYEIPVVLSKKINLEWKFGGIRPVNQPVIKLMQFSSFFYLTNTFLIDAILNLEVEKIMTALKKVKIHSYWETHSRYNKKCKERKINLGISFQNHLLINAVFPLAFHLNHKLMGLDVSDKIIDYYQNGPKELNRILRFMEQNEFRNQNSLDSQALIQLFNNYCKQKKCLNCNIGAKILK